VISNDQAWRTGERIEVRGDAWTIVELMPFADCEVLRLAGVGRANAGAARTIIVPFDRPVRQEWRASIQIVRPRRWLRVLHRIALDAHPFGGLSAAAPCAIDLLPYQIEPALAMLRRGVTRVMIADAVGLGKTIQAGLILQELSARRESFRALIVSPAGLREQWSHELRARFGLHATIAGAAWLAAIGREVPPDVNPWILPGIYISSFDFVKRPEVLGPLEETGWDILIADEAHEAALGTARRAAVHAIASRARRVVLLTATPHAGDTEQFRALCGIGRTNAAADRLMLFRRSRSDVAACAPRRSVLLPVRLSDQERRMHRLLETYTSRLCHEAVVRGDVRARLAAIVLRKRALSSAASLAVSCRRRLALLAGPAVEAEHQLALPLGEEEPLGDREPDSLLAAPGLADGARERRWLAAIAEAAQYAARNESKVRCLIRLLARMREPAIVFTEYRDTLERLRRALTAARHDVVLLHGGMDLSERSAAQAAFNERGSLLLATDAASEGLNLHHRCRAVIHFELPWSPARLEQRTGRVDRIGQARTVHEIVLVADDTAERLVLAPLARRAAIARTSVPGRSRLLDLLTESRVADAVLEATVLTEADGDREMPEGFGDSGLDAVPAPIDLRDEALAEVARLRIHRAWIGRAAERGVAGIAASAIRVGKGRTPPGFVCIYALSLAGDDGAVAHAQVVAVHTSGEPVRMPRTAMEVRRLVRRFVESRGTAVREAVTDRFAGLADLVAADVGRAVSSLERREQGLAAATPSAARQLVQAGLFDQRAVRADAARRRAAVVQMDDVERQLGALKAARRLAFRLDLRAVLVAASRAER
jgi:superfamily II DNA or RNA helicase